MCDHWSHSSIVLASLRGSNPGLRGCNQCFAKMSKNHSKYGNNIGYGRLKLRLPVLRLGVWLWAFHSRSVMTRAFIWHQKVKITNLKLPNVILKDREMWLVKLWCQKRFLPGLCWENPCFMLGQTLFSQLFKLNAWKILALCWENSFLAPEFH